MARKIIILNRIKSERLNYDYVLWADVPLARQPFHSNALAESSYTSVSAQELQDIRNGKTAETGGSIQLEPGDTIATARTKLESIWQDFQDDITNETTYDRYGTSWDGTTWTSGGV